MNYIQNNLEIDWVSCDIYVEHNENKISNGCIIDADFNIGQLSNENLNLEYIRVRNKSKNIYSDSDKDQFIRLTSKKNIVNINGNIFKWLYGQNVKGESNLIKLIYDLVEKLTDLELIYPTKDQIHKIENGNFRLYRIDVKQDLIFPDKEKSLRYLDHIITLGYYPYKKKEKYKNGCYFGMQSKTRWNIRYYHKGTELRDKNKRFYIDPELFALAELMIRSEIRILNAQLKDWNLSNGYDWKDLKKVDLFFSDMFKKLKLPDVIEREEFLNIISKSDRKFYAIVKKHDPKDFYSRATISSKRIKFLNQYGIDIDDLRTKKRVV